MQKINKSQFHFQLSELCMRVLVYLVVIIDELQGKSCVGQLHGLQQGSVWRRARLQRSLTSKWVHTSFH